MSEETESSSQIMREVLNVKRRMYTPNEVALHNCMEDIWLAVFGKVYDLTSFVRENEGVFVFGFDWCRQCRAGSNPPNIRPINLTF